MRYQPARTVVHAAVVAHLRQPLAGGQVAVLAPEARPGAGEVLLGMNAAEAEGVVARVAVAAGPRRVPALVDGGADIQHGQRDRGFERAGLADSAPAGQLSAAAVVGPAIDEGHS